MGSMVSISHAKARLSEVVRDVRARGEETIITIDGQPVARVVPVSAGPRSLTDAETATVRALMSSLNRIERQPASFDAVELVGEGRR